MTARYAVLPEYPEPDDLVPLADVLCEMVGLPQTDAHPSSVGLLSEQTARVYQAIWRVYAVPSVEKD